MDHTSEYLELVNESKRRIKEITTEETLKLINDNKDFILLDIREESEWNANRIIKADYLGRGILERDIISRHPDKAKLIVLYCGGGFRSALGADNLQKMGYTNVFSMAGGITEWREKNYPTEN
jgi:rhodanese-related sulfurtransferase